MTSRIGPAAWLYLTLLGLAAGCSPAGSAIEQDLPAPPSAPTSEKQAGPSAGGHGIVLGDRLTMSAPDSWIAKPPGNPMILQEFAVPAAKGDPRDGRVTVSSVGGTVAANIDRWAGQFHQPDGAKTADKMKVQKKTVAGQEVDLVDISGTYEESAGMMQPPVPRPDYRMLAAILPGDGPSFFIKFYGPKKTVGEHEKEFQAMLDGIKAR